MKISKCIVCGAPINVKILDAHVCNVCGTLYQTTISEKNELEVVDSYGKCYKYVI